MEICGTIKSIIGDYPLFRRKNMDNNFNQNQNFQNQNFQNQQDPFGNNYAQAPKSPASFNLFELISIILSGVGMLMVFIGSIFTCTCSAKKTFSSVYNTAFTMSPVFVVSIFGILFAAAGVVLAILAIKDTKSAKKAGIIAKISFVLGAFAIIYGIIPIVTICGYNCSLNSEIAKW